MLFRSFDAFFLTALRSAIATAVLVVMLFAVRPWPARLGISPRRLAWLSFTLAVFFVLYNLGLLFTDPITAAAVMAGAPVYAALTLRLTGGSGLGPGFGLAAVMTMLGAGVAVWGKSGGATAAPSIHGGEVFFVASFVCWNLYSLFAQRWFAPEVGQLQRVTIAMGVAAVWLAAFWLLAWGIGLSPAPNLSPDGEAIAYLLITAVFASAIGPFVWNVGVNRMGLAAGSLWQNMVPVFAVLISLLFGIRPSAAQIAGGAIVIAGVLTMQWRRLRSLR